MLQCRFFSLYLQMLHASERRAKQKHFMANNITTPTPRALELLTPAKNLACGIAAIDHGADAVFIGAECLGARAAAGNSVEDIAALCAYAHQFRVKVYVTLNTIIYNHETASTQKLIRRLYEAGVDALIVQDMGVTHMDIPPIELHASTQTDNRTAAKVSWLHSLGFTRVVLARELSVDAIAAIHAAEPTVELEVFVHGALCVSFSGVCYVSQHCFNRSANRGECAQFCRMSFDLIDANDREIEHQRHLLSLKDMCRIDDLESLADAGATSFKIEGRLKDVSYVKNVVAAYRRRLDKVIAAHPQKYCHASAGRVKHGFEPNLNKTFNRGFTRFFLDGRERNITSFDTPKAVGEPVGKVKEMRRDSFTVAGTASFANGDGLCFMNESRQLEGFRVNRAEGNRLFPNRMPTALRPGMQLFRNNDEAFEKLLAKPSATRKIAVTMQLSTTGNDIALDVQAEGFAPARATMSLAHQEAQKPQRENIVRQLTKLGNTVYECAHLDITPEAERCFIPSSTLTELRRNALAALQPLPRKQAPKLPKRTNDKPNLVWQAEYQRFPYTYNIANKLATDFYQDQGMTHPAAAFEVKGDAEVPASLLMQCKHCLRYSLGHCVKHGGVPPRWQEPLFLRLSDGRKFRLQFDCQQCQMNIYATNS